MKFRNLILTGAAMLMASPVFASTYYGGFEDYATNKSMASDFDYNDIVFSLSSSSLSLKSSDGMWYSSPSVNQDGTPFWDNNSYDGSKKNVGYCIYGGGNCGAALAPGAQFLANGNTPGKAANTVYFSTADSVATTVFLSITSANDTLYWYKIGNNTLHQINNGLGSFSFNPGGDFGLAGYNAATGRIFYTQINSDDPNEPSHFAFFQPTPEPGTMGAMAGGLILLGTIYRRRKAADQK